MKKLITPRFKVHPAGLARLLQRDIYDKNDVYLRELIQNACDSGATEIQVLVFRESTDSKTVWCLGCADNGRGMTENELQESFLNLCRPTEALQGSRFGRFGIGLFTYFSFAGIVNVFTQPEVGTPTDLQFVAPDDFCSLEEIKITRLQNRKSGPVGTSILLRPRFQITIEEVHGSLRRWIRSNLPAAITVREIVRPSSEKLNASVIRKASTLPSMEGNTVAWSLQARNPDGGNEQLESVVLHLHPGTRDRIALCESGILIEDCCTDIAPSAFAGIGFQGTISVVRGFLGLSASRSNALRDDRFHKLVALVSEHFESAFLRAYRGYVFRMSNNWGQREEILHRVLGSTEISSAVALLRKIDDNLLFRVLGQNESLSLRVIASRGAQTRIIHYLDGETYGWRTDIGRIGSYSVSVLVQQLILAETVARNGGIVFNIPRNDKGLRFVSVEVLQRYFATFGLSMEDAAPGSRLPVRTGVFPPKWCQRLRIPAHASVGQLPAGMPVMFNSNKMAVIDIRQRALSRIDQVLNRPFDLHPSARAVMNCYLALLAADLDGAQSVLESDIARSADELPPAEIPLTSGMQQLEKLLRNVVEDHRENNWNEDFITRLFLHELRKLHVTVLGTADYPMKAGLNAWKLSGRKEQDFGDIGILVRLRYPDGLEVEGAGFMEAKRKYAKSGEFDKLEVQQLLTISSNFAFAKVLLYDFSPVSFSRVMQEPRTTYGVSVPVSVVLHLNERKRTHVGDSLYRFGIPVSHQIFHRYFRGEDLDFGRRSLDIVRGEFPGLLSPSYVLCAAVGLHGASPPEIPAPNNDHYQAIGNERDEF